MKNIGININTEKDIDGSKRELILKAIYENNKDANIVIYENSQGLEKERTSELDALIVLGGDGTILGAARRSARYGVPILGINIGHLGFLTDCDCSDAAEAIKNLLNGNYRIEERTMLDCTFELWGKEKRFNALNEVVLSKGTLIKIIRYDVFVDGDFYGTFVSDGVIVSTATGSTAYSLSCGGPFVYPTLDSLILSPICPHSMNMRSMLLDNRVKIDVDLSKNTENVFLTLDGQEWMELDQVKKVSIMAAKEKCMLIRTDVYNYFNVLRKKIAYRTMEGEGGENENRKTL
ncbi:MAG: NAD(+)/NADH kinase [Clostridiaceae bacterium]